MGGYGLHGCSRERSRRIGRAETVIHPGGVLNYILNSLSAEADEGRIVPAVSPGHQYRHAYHYRDQLGNLRLAFSDLNNNGTAEVGDILQEAHYYPYGLGFSGLTTVSNGVPSRHTFNGKEAQEAFGMGWIDFGARMYDAQLGRWMAVDPLTDEVPGWSPYRAFYDNPIRYTDVGGKLEGDFYAQNGKFLGSDGNDDGRVYVVVNETEVKRSGKIGKQGGLVMADQLESEIELPSKHVRSETSKVMDMDKDNPFREYGGIYGKDVDGNEIVIWAKPGPEADPAVDREASIGTFNYQNPEDLAKLVEIFGTFHSHPSGTTRKPKAYKRNVYVINPEKENHFFNQPPSEQDFTNAKNRTERGGSTGYSIVIGAAAKTVFLYDGNGVIATFPIEQWKNVGK